jgi:hypothetical protein
MLVSTKLMPGITFFPAWDGDAIHLGDAELRAEPVLRARIVVQRVDAWLDTALPQLVWYPNRLGGILNDLTYRLHCLASLANAGYRISSMAAEGGVAGLIGTGVAPWGGGKPRAGRGLSSGLGFGV